MKRRKSRGKTFAFIDASNIIYGARAEGWFIDLHKLLKYLKQYKHAIVLTGDGDFTPLLRYITSKRKKVTIISSPKRTAREIKVIAGDKHVDFGSLRYLLEYKKRGRP